MIDNVSKNEAQGPKGLFAFNFIGGGFNQVYGVDKVDAIKNAQAEFPSLAAEIDFLSFRFVRDEDAYYSNLPFMNKDLLIPKLKLLKHSYADIGYHYEGLTTAEQGIITKEEFECIVAEMIYHNVMTVEEFLAAFNK